MRYLQRALARYRFRISQHAQHELLQQVASPSGLVRPLPVWPSRACTTQQGLNPMSADRCQLAFALTAALIAASGCTSNDSDTAKVSSTSGEALRLHYAYDPL